MADKTKQVCSNRVIVNDLVNAQKQTKKESTELKDLCQVGQYMHYENFWSWGKHQKAHLKK